VNDLDTTSKSGLSGDGFSWEIHSAYYITKFQKRMPQGKNYLTTTNSGRNFMQP